MGLMHMENLDMPGSAEHERVVELRDYSSKSVLQDAVMRNQSRSGDPLAEMKQIEASMGKSRCEMLSRSTPAVKYLHEDKEAALLSGSSRSQVAMQSGATGSASKTTKMH